MLASGKLEFFAELETGDATQVDLQVGRGRIAVTATLGVGREVRAMLATEAQAELCRLFQQPLVDTAGRHWLTIDLILQPPAR
jgi:hypothetical protein